MRRVSTLLAPIFTGLTVSVVGAPKVTPAQVSLRTFLSNFTARLPALAGSAANAAVKPPKGTMAVVAVGSRSRQLSVPVVRQVPVLPEVAVTAGVVS